MANSYYTVTYDFEPFTSISSAQVDAEFAAVVSAFDLLPAPTAFYSGNLSFVAAGGTANAITVANPISTWASYTGKDGYRINIQITTENTGAVTLAVDGLTAKACVKNSGAALESGDLQASGFYDFIYDETAGNFKVLVEANSVTDADKLGGVTAANYARTDIADTFEAGFRIDNNQPAYFKDSSGSSQNGVTLNGSDIFIFGDTDIDTALLRAGTNIKVEINSSEVVEVTSAGVEVTGNQVISSGDVQLDNAQSIQFKDAGGTYRDIVELDANDDLQIGDATHVDVVRVDAADYINFYIGGAQKAYLSSAGLISATDHTPAVNNAIDSGSASFAWADIYSVNAPTTTSDARMKEDITSLTNLSLDLINLLNPVSYKWKDYVEDVIEEEAKDEKLVLRPVTEEVEVRSIVKEWDEDRQAFVQREMVDVVSREVCDTFPLLDENGDPILDKEGDPVVEKKVRMEEVLIPAKEAVTREQSHTHVRTHYGLIAQEVEQALITAGLDPNQIGAFIHDRENDRYAVRYNELIAPMIKAIQVLSSKNDDLEARIQTLENA